MPALEPRLDATGDAERGNCDRSIRDRSATRSHPGLRRASATQARVGAATDRDDPEGVRPVSGRCASESEDARQRMLSPAGRAPVPFVA